MAKEIDVVIVLSGGFCSTIPSEKLAEYLEPLKSKKIISMAIPLPLEGSYHTYSGCEDVYTEIIGHLAKEHGCKVVPICAEIEAQLSEFDEEEKNPLFLTKKRKGIC